LKPLLKKYRKVSKAPKTLRIRFERFAGIEAVEGQVNSELTAGAKYIVRCLSK
jgi:hypothetical protein